MIEDQAKQVPRPSGGPLSRLLPGEPHLKPARVLAALFISAAIALTGEFHSANANLQNQWSDAAVWGQPDNWFQVLDQDCGFPVSLSPARPDDFACIVKAMSASGADPEAISFFAATQTFLLQFDEQGRVDLGVAGAPWINMNRPAIVFLNGEPSVITLFEVVAETYAAESGGPLPWPEYAQVEATAELVGGGQQIRVSMPLRECRACPDVGQLMILVGFD